MAARLKRLHQDDIRAKIKVAALIDILSRNALGELPVEMSHSRVTSAKILLDKAMSNAPTQVGGIDGGPLTVKIVQYGSDDPG